MSNNKAREICYYLQRIAAVYHAAALQHQLATAACSCWYVRPIRHRQTGLFL